MKREKGITLIALVVTIIVLIILASISIGTLTGKNGIIGQSKDAKEQTEIAEEKEVVSLAATKAAGVDRYGNVTKDNLEKELDELAGEGKTTVTGNGPFTVTFVESERKYVVETDGQIFDENEIVAETEKKSLKFLVNSGDDGVVVMPIPLVEWVEGKFEVDWGDGTTGVDDMFLSQADMKIASTETYVAKYSPDAGTGTPHIYYETNKEYTVTITGKCTRISSGMDEVTQEKIIEVLQWGETGLEYINLGNCNNLRKIASPSENSFINIEAEYGFAGAFFYCTSLTEIPEDLFSNCSQVKDFSATFAYCSGLEKIPENLFANCSNVEVFEGTFAFCENLTGNAINLWQRVPNGANNDYIGIPEGQGCYYECEKLNDYYEIPGYWRDLPQ